MRTNKSILLRMLFLSTLIVIFSFVLTFSLSGCGPAASPEEEVSQEESAQTEETTEESEDTSVETSEEVTEETESSVANMEITGNINKFSGLELSDEVLSSRPVAVMIENSTAARPQSGLINADIVFEVVDEWNITRYVAVFSSYEAEIMGPIRSARVYYAEIARSFDPIYAFFGTYPPYFPIIEGLGMDILTAVGDQTGKSSITANAPSWRDYTRSDVSWSSAFMSTIDLKETADNLGYSLEGGQSPLHFKLDAAEPDRGNITDIIIDISIAEFLIDFKYDSKTNKYLKSTAGEPHIDFESKEQLSVNNVVVLITDISGPVDKDGHMEVRTTQSGEAYFFMDGDVVEGTWGRTSAFDPFEFKDKDGNTVLFNRGSTWVCMIPGIDRLMY